MNVDTRGATLDCNWDQWIAFSNGHSLKLQTRSHACPQLQYQFQFDGLVFESCSPLVSHKPFPESNLFQSDSKRSVAWNGESCKVFNLASKDRSTLESLEWDLEPEKRKQDRWKLPVFPKRADLSKWEILSGTGGILQFFCLDLFSPYLLHHSICNPAQREFKLAKPVRIGHIWPELNRASFSMAYFENNYWLLFMEEAYKECNRVKE